MWCHTLCSISKLWEKLSIGKTLRTTCSKKTTNGWGRQRKWFNIPSISSRLTNLILKQLQNQQLQLLWRNQKKFKRYHCRLLSFQQSLSQWTGIRWCLISNQNFIPTKCKWSLSNLLSSSLPSPPSSWTMTPTISLSHSLKTWEST